MCFDSNLISSQFENIKVPIVKIPVPSLGCSANAAKDVVDNKPPVDNQPAVLPDGTVDSKKDSTVEESKEVVPEVKEEEKSNSDESLKSNSDESLKSNSVSAVEPVQEHSSNQV